MKKQILDAAATQLQEKIHRTIPLSAAMQFSIIELNPYSIIVGAPLQPNINIHGTGFAGSLYSVAILTGWALSTHIMSLHDMAGELVVGKAEIKYRAPVTDDFICRAMVSETDSQIFQKDFESSGKARLNLTVDIGDGPNAVVQGLYIAMK
jgi:thioesterase domain-containing protein